jgi:DNA-binding MarR family transcriptional regulator
MEQQHAIADDFAAEVAGACLGMRVARLHRVIARLYEQALQTVGLTQPQMEILASLISAAGPVRPAALAERLMLERSTISRNLALMQKRGWVGVAQTSATGRAMSVTITDAGIAAFTSADTAWRRAQADAARMLGPDAASTLDQWLGPDAATSASPERLEVLMGSDSAGLGGTVGGASGERADGSGDHLIWLPGRSLVLDAAQLGVLRGYGSERDVAAGDVLFADGDETCDLIVLLEGTADIIEGYGQPGARVVTGYGRSEFWARSACSPGSARS